MQYGIDTLFQTMVATRFMEKLTDHRRSCCATHRGKSGLTDDTWMIVGTGHAASADDGPVARMHSGQLAADFVSRMGS